MIYKGYKIPKFKNFDGKYVPSHVIAEYYRDEKDRIDRMIRIETMKTKNSNSKSVNECLEDFFNEMGVN